VADEDPPRSLAARAAAELALVRIANCYGGRPEFVLLGGLVPALLAKTVAAYSRRKPKDWYDIAYVLLNNDYGYPAAAAERVWQVFGASIASAESALTDLSANFAGSSTQGTSAYVDQITLDYPDIDPATAAADGQIAVQAFCDDLLGRLADDGSPQT
jgi:hypothetical protein